MKSFKLFLSILILLLSASSIVAQEVTHFQYRSPLPDSKLLSRETNIIFSHSEFIDQSSLSVNNLITLTGSQSGLHKGELILSDDGKTIVFNPYQPFAAGEVVSVLLGKGIKTINGKPVAPESYSFTVTPLQEPIWLDPIERLGTGLTLDDLINRQPPLQSPALDSLPADFPEITVGTVNNPAPGNIFTTNIRFGGTNTDGFFLMILDDTGYPVKYKRMETLPAVYFDAQPNGLLSYADISHLFGIYGFTQFKVTDTSFAIIDSFQCGNGYQADFHEFRLLENGHAILMAYDPQPFDMSSVVPGGDPNAIVIGGIIQEIDADKNVVFQWRSWDHVNFADSYSDLTTSTVDYIHMNAVELDADGNLLLSSRHFSEITKISRQTGEIIWRLGGKNNEFTFINEDPSNAPIYFSFQHDIRRIANGNITLFDNGNQHSPSYSRGVEYELDEQNKTATLVWEYRHDPDIYGFATGSVQRLPNGNTLIGWGAGAVSGEAFFTEVHPDNTVATEMFLPVELATYRVLKYPWATGLPAAVVTITEVLEGNTYTFNEPGNNTGTKIKFNVIESLLYNSVTVKRYEYAPKQPIFNGRAPAVYPARITVQALGVDSLNVDIWFNVNHLPQITDPANTVVYQRTSIGSGTFVPLATTYLPGTNELKVSSLTEVGEFIFAYPDVPVVPTIPQLVYPENGELVNQNLSVELQWSPQGFADKFHLQAATDAAFNSKVVDDSTLTTVTYSLSPLLQEQDYYWRVKSKNTAGWGGWSDVWSFTATAPFLEVVFPNGGEEWKTDTSMAIIWDHNLTDSVKVELYKNDGFFKSIADSFYSLNGGYKWVLTDSIPDGTDYKIKVTTLDGSFMDMSDNNFTIIYIPVSVEQIEEVAADFSLEQNYPNPFNPGTVIRYSVPVQSRVTLKIFNSIGENITTLLDETQSSGRYELEWVADNLASGIYFYSIEAIPTDGSNVFRSVRKMILLK